MFIHFCKAAFCYLRYLINLCAAGTSDGGYESQSVSLAINLIKNKVNQMLPSSYISSLLSEGSGSVVECVTGDREAAGSSLTGVLEQDTFILA